MYCPFCAAHDTRVVDSRLANEGRSVRRRRECTVCNQRFTTFEAVELQLPYLVKRDGAREAFDTEKLRRGMLKALEKRPVSMAQVDQAITTIRQKLNSCGEQELPSQQLGEWVMQALKELDQVAYVRFASVYRRFQDVDEFRREIEKLIRP